LNKYIELLSALSPKSADVEKDVVQQSNAFNDKNAVLCGLVNEPENYTNLIIAVAMNRQVDNQSRKTICAEVAADYLSRIGTMQKSYKPKKAIKTNEIYTMANYAFDWILRGRYNINQDDISKELSALFCKDVSRATFVSKYEFHLALMISGIREKIDDICERAYKRIG
jgi:hypothetical protein